MPALALEMHVSEMRRIRAMESLDLIQSVSAGQGQLKKTARKSIIRRLEREQRPAQRSRAQSRKAGAAAWAALATIGIGVRKAE